MSVLFTNVTVLTMDGSRKPLKDAFVAVEGDKIAYLGAALTSQGRMTGTLTAEEIRLLALLEGGGQGMTLKLAENLWVEATARSGARIDIAGEQAAVQVLATVYVPAGKAIDARQVEEALQRKLEALIAQMQKARSDAAGFQRHTLAPGWNFAEAHITVEVKVQLVIRG